MSAVACDWLPFYGDDFFESESVAGMDDSAVGLYLWLLWRQWKHGPLPGPNTLRRLNHRWQVRWDEVWPQVAAKFEVDDDGRLSNARLRALRAEADTRLQKAQESGRRGGLARVAQATLEGSLKAASSEPQALTGQDRTEEKKKTHPNPPEGRADRFGILLDVIRTVPGNYSATVVHTQVATAIREAGFELDVECPVPDRGDGKRGLVDIRVRDPDCWIEIDRCRPRDKSIVKLRSTPGRRVIVLRSAEWGDHPCAEGIDAVIGLGGEGGRLTEEQVREALARVPSLDTDGFRLAFSLWLKYRDEKRIQPYRPIGLQACLAQLAKIGPERAIAAIEHTMGKGWQGIREEEAARGGSPVPKARPPSQTEYKADPEWVRKRMEQDQESAARFQRVKGEQ